MVHWSEPETMIVPDAADTPDTEFYAMPAFTYEGIYVGLLWNFRTTNTTMHPQAVFSRDGIHYNREFQDPFIDRGPHGEFDSSVVYVDAPIVHQDRILTYYTGVNWRSPESLLALGDKAVGAIGLGVTRLDGFVSLDGARTVWSEAVTRSVTFTGSRLHLNLASALNSGGPEGARSRWSSSRGTTSGSRASRWKMRIPLPPAPPTRSCRGAATPT